MAAYKLQNESSPHKGNSSSIMMVSSTLCRSNQLSTTVSIIPYTLYRFGLKYSSSIEVACIYAIAFPDKTYENKKHFIFIIDSGRVCIDRRIYLNFGVEVYRVTNPIMYCASSG